jgi:leucyl aminopeptidase (aminopeptidase T)
MEAEELEILSERRSLAMERISRIPTEKQFNSNFDEYFEAVAAFVKMVDDTYTFIQDGGMSTAPLDELKKRNYELYADILPENYEQSYANPAYSTEKLGEKFGALMAAVYTELRSMIGFAYEKNLYQLVIREELFVEIYAEFVYEIEEERNLPSYDSIKDIFYWFASDYADEAADAKIYSLVVPDDNFAADIIMNADLNDSRYLYYYGEYVSDNEILMADFMSELSDKEIATMADTYTEGYRIGFEVGGKDLSKKKTVDIRYQLGFERMIRWSIENFEKMGLKPVIYRASYSLLYNPSLNKAGFFGSSPNRQYEFDHKDDRALIFDKNYVNRKLEVTHTALEKYKAQARLYAGPAVVETFGEKNFEPVNKPERITMSDEQNKLWVDYRSRAGRQQREYILEEERSFTIIAFPIPEIIDSLPQKTPECFDRFFKDIISINTLDYKLYQGIQQTIIDALDKADYCVIKGKGDNSTDLKVNLHKLNCPDKETIFENCVADVNIPVGEVFTSPVLEGTEGVLNVGKVYLNGLEYRNLTLIFEDGMIKDYTCDNFEREEDNLSFISENVLYRHRTLPMGEFAIGTNTTAYVVAEKYGVQDKFPILIAEKMGPHFAVGDTCYSHAEEVRVYNPDGKEIVAKDNECSRLRDTKPDKAYFNCHTDITIPYDELELVEIVRKDNTRTAVIRDGRFVLAGTEKLNEAFGD